MKRTFAIIVCILLFAGCSQADKTEQQSQRAQLTPTIEPTPSPVEATATPEPTEIPAQSAESLRVMGKSAILGLIPEEYRVAIPYDEIEGLEASLDSETCTVAIGWATAQPIADAALLLGQKLPYELVQGDDDWRNPDGAEYPNIRLKQSDGGLTILYIIDPSMAAGTLLTVSFPLDAIGDIPDSLDIGVAEKRVSYRQKQDIWNYELNWVLSEDEGAAIESKILELYQARENYHQEQKQEDTSVTFTISQSEEMSISLHAGEKYHLTASYQFKAPGHFQSADVQAFIQNPQGCLLLDLPEEYPTILIGLNGITATIYVQDHFIEYRLSAPDSEDHQAIADRAAQVTGGVFAENGHGGYDCTVEGYAMTLKFNGNESNMEISKPVDEGFTHPYINDIYPSSYDPVLPEQLEKEPYSITTEYAQNESVIEAGFQKSWQLDDEQTAKAAFEAMKDACKDYHGYAVESNDGNQTIHCRIKEYGFMCQLSEKGGKWYITLQFNYR